MITTAFVQLGYILISGFVSILPNSSGFPTSVTTAATTFGGYFGMFSPLIPIGTLATAVSIAFAVEIAVFGWKTFKSVASHIPLIGGAGH